MPLQSSQTFSERRGSGPIELNRTNLSRTDGMNSQNNNEEKGKGDSVVKILIWVVVVVLVAVVIYLLINNLAGNKTPSTDNNDDQTQEETGLDPITAEKISSEGVEGAPEDSDLSTDDQSVGSSSSDVFTLDSVAVESYEGFLRVIFAVTSSGSAKFPKTEASLENEKITLTFDGVTEENTDIPAGEEQEIIGSIVTGILHDISSSEDSQVFVVNLDSETGYYLHLLEDPNRIVLDVKEEVQEEPSEETPEETPDTTDETPTGKPTVVTLTNEFSKNPQWIVSEVTGNTVTTTKYQWQDLGTYVRITYDLSGGIPNVEAKLEDGTSGKVLTVIMSNRVSKNASSTIPINRGNVTTMDAVTAGNTSTLTIHLVKESDYRIYATESPAKFMIEVKD